jgi:hypothetical protein
MFPLPKMGGAEEDLMGVKNIHVVLIVVSIILSLSFGFWTLNHEYTAWGYCSFTITLGLIVYCAQFIKKMRTL